MGSIEAGQAQGNTQELPLHKRVMDALDKKIADDPFYTGRNAVLFGLSTPIRKNRAVLAYSPGTTSEDFYLESVFEFQEKESTPDSLHREIMMERERATRTPVVETAEEVYEGTLVVHRDPNTGFTERKDKSRINWRNQKNWVRNWEVSGSHLGGDNSLQKTADRYGIKQQRAVQIVDEQVNDMRIHLLKMPYSMSDNKSSGKPLGLINLRRDLGNAEDPAVGILSEVERGERISNIIEQHSGYNVDYLRNRLRKVIGENVISFANLAHEDPNYFLPLSDPNVSKEEKTRLLFGILPSILKYGDREALHVLPLSDALASLAFPKNHRTLSSVASLIIERDKEIAIRIEQSIREGKVVGKYYFLADGDLPRLAKVVKHSDFDQYRK